MAMQAFIDPASQITATNWTASAGNTVTAVSKAVRQPTVPTGTPNDTDNGNAGPSVLELKHADPGLGAPLVSTVKAWIYRIANGGAVENLTLELYTGATQLATTGAVGMPAAADWRSVTYTGTLTQPQLADLRIRVTTSNTVANQQVIAEYVEINYTPSASRALVGVGA